MTKESHQSLEKLQSVADIRLALVADIISALAGRMAELLELREAVRKAEDAAARPKAKVASPRGAELRGMGKKLSVLCIALCAGLSTTTAFGRGGGGHHSAASGGASGTSAAAPGTNSLGTALSTSIAGSTARGFGIGSADMDRENAKENAKLDTVIKSICRGC
jgi:hypothetical protein